MKRAARHYKRYLVKLRGTSRDLSQKVIETVQQRKSTCGIIVLNGGQIS